MIIVMTHPHAKLFQTLDQVRELVRAKQCLHFLVDVTTSACDRVNKARKEALR